MYKVVSIIVAVKLTYGPISTCVSLIKTEAFPTEIRASAFSFVSVISKIGCALAPTVIEALKGDGTADSWKMSELNDYTCSLAVAVMLTGFGFILIPWHIGDTTPPPLEDYVFEEDKCGERQAIQGRGSAKNSPIDRSYGSLHGERANTLDDTHGSVASAGSVWDIWLSRNSLDDSGYSVKSVNSSASSSATRASSDRKALLPEHLRAALKNPPKGTLASRLEEANAMPSTYHPVFSGSTSVCSSLDNSRASVTANSDATALDDSRSSARV
jgi:hypothetical protein